MSKSAFLLAAAAASAFAAATPALADGRHEPFDGITEQAISQIVTFAGYDVVDIDFEGRFYHVEAYEPAGRKVALRVRADDGSILPPAPVRQDARVVRE